MTPLDLFRELARPARHDHRNLTPTQTALENTARAAATGLVLAVHCVARVANVVADTACTVRLVAHLWRDQ